MKCIIFVPSYNVSKFLDNTLERIPVLNNSLLCTVLIIDDGSIDGTFDVAKKYLSNNIYKTSKNISEIIVIKHKNNLGYGSVQITAIDYAIDNNYDYIIMLHGDGQYAPEQLNIFINFLTDGSDLVFGSRMGNIINAYKGGMPIYKIIGNFILTKFQNIILNSNLSEFHSGYRGYKVSWIKNIPYYFNSCDFSFDTEILIQALLSNAKIKEFDIPTFYGEEICNVPGFRYAFKVALVSFIARCYKLNLTLDKRFNGLISDKYGSDDGLTELHSLVILMINSNSSVLDLGCGAGGFINKLQIEKKCNVLGIDNLTFQIDNRIRCADLQSEIFSLNKNELNSNVITCLEVIEHLTNPDILLTKLYKSFNNEDEKVFIFSTPNIAHISIRLMLFFGIFSYGRRGILDSSHVKLYTKDSFINLLNMNGFDVVNIVEVGLPLDKIFSNYRIKYLFRCIEKLLLTFFPTLFAFQFICRCTRSSDKKELREFFF